MIEIEKPQIECMEDPGERHLRQVSSWSRWSAATASRWAMRCAALCSRPCPAPRRPSIKIAGVQHEFSTIPGVKEDVTEIVLNVKSLITRLHNADGIKTVYIEAVGPVRGQGRRHQGRRRGRGPQPRPAHRNAGRRRDAEHGDHPFPRPRLCVRRPQQDRADVPSASFPLTRSTRPCTRSTTPWKTPAWAT